MNTRQEVLKAIELRISEGHLSQEQIKHLRSELTIARLIDGGDTISNIVAETSDLTPYTPSARQLVSSGWRPSDFNGNANGYVLFFAPLLSELFKQGLLTPYAAKKMAHMGGKHNLLRELAKSDDKRNECIKLLTMTPLSCNDWVDLGSVAARAVLKNVNKVVFLMKHNLLTIYDLRLFDANGRVNPLPRSKLPGSSHSWYIDCKIYKKYAEVMQARANTGMASRVLSQGARSSTSFFSILPAELDLQILMFVDPIGDREASNLIRERFARPSPVGFFGGLSRFIDDSKQKIEERVSEFINKKK